MSRPLIAVAGYHLRPGRVSNWRSGGFAVPAPYIEALDRAGAVPAILSPGTGAAAGDAATLLRRFDGLLLVGGGDVAPSRYGAEPHASVGGVDLDRDDLEFGLLRAADAVGTPTLAVCRGAQVMNVAFGGSLIQHLPDTPSLVPHGVPGGTAAVHEVKVSESSRLYAAAASSVLACSSHHHQGLDRLGEEILPTGWSGDGLVEAIERPTGWMVGVQWHPEDTAASDPGQQGLFDALVQRAGA